MKVLTIGTFDLFHVGHLKLLERAAGFGQLWVGVNSDSFVESYKGRAAVVPERDRLKLVSALKCVQTAVINNGPGRELIFAGLPHLLVIGSDWHEKRYLDQIDVRQRELDERGIGVLYLPRTPGISTTALRS